MAENLNIGTMVPGSASSANQSNDALIEKYCYSDTEANCTTDGGLYQWSEAMGLAGTCNSATCAAQISTGHHQGICPVGWHIPKKAEWDLLATMLGGSSVAGQKMKLNTTGYSSWDASTKNDGNTSGFSALPAGYRYSGGGFYNRGDNAGFWEASEYNASYANYRYLHDGYALLDANYSYKADGFSVRCFRDF